MYNEFFSNIIMSRIPILKISLVAFEFRIAFVTLFQWDRDSYNLSNKRTRTEIENKHSITDNNGKYSNDDVIRNRQFIKEDPS